jgi:hypothetical protein
MIAKKSVFMAHDQAFPTSGKAIKQYIVRFFYRFFSAIRVINTGEHTLLEKK